MNISQWLNDTFENWDVIERRLPEATFETLGMVGWSTLITALLGLPLGLVLYATSVDGVLPRKVTYSVLSLIVNIGRSIPFIILMIAVIPFTRLVVGTTLGWQAAVVPLSLGAIPFYARLVEAAVRDVSGGKTEAAQMVGASRWRVSGPLMFREALPALISALTVTVIALVSYSAMAGAVGGGGLGALAIRYGYNRYQYDVMIITVIVIVIVVQLVQLLGDYITRRLDHR